MATDVMDLLAKVEFDSDDFDKGMDRMSSRAKSTAGAIAATLGAAMTAAAAGAAALVKQSTSAYAEYEQLVGGVETLFSNLEGTVSAAPTVLENAANAYKTAGMSANQYMETVTSFSAALIAGLENDYDAAARVSDMAISDMADNANKLGTSLSSIQLAYQGFSRQQYQLLDNLKLGYGGTKTEMERLLRDAEEFSGVHYDISNLADVYEAIHVIQQEMGITGTTAKEASGTISGSIGQLGGAWANLVAGFANSQADLPALINDVVQSAEVSFTNLLPTVEQAITGIATFVEDLAPIIAEKLPDVAQEIIPPLLSTANEVVNTLVASLPGMLDTIVDIVPVVLNDISETVIGLLPEVSRLALRLTLSLANGIKENAPMLVRQATTAIDEIIDTLSAPETIDAIFDTGLGLIESLAMSIDESLPRLVETASNLIVNLVEYLLNPDNRKEIYETGGKIIGSLASGLVKSAAVLLDAAIDLTGEIVKGLLSTDWIVFGADLTASIVTGFAEGFSDADKAFETGLNEIDQMFGTHFAKWRNDWNNFFGDIGGGLYNILHPDAGEAAFTYEEALERLTAELSEIEPVSIAAANAIHIPTEALRQMRGEEAAVIKELPKMLTETATTIRQGAEKVEEAVKYAGFAAQEIGTYQNLGVQYILGHVLTDAEEVADKIASEVYSASNDFVTRLTEQEDLTVEDQIKWWQKIQGQFVDGSKQFIQAGDKILALQKKNAADIQKAEETATKKAEQEYEKRKKAYESYQNDVQTISDRIKEIENSYADTLTKRSEDIYNSFGLFEAIPERILYSGIDLTNNLQNQIDSLEKFYTDVATLAERGVSGALVEEIQSMGVGALDQLDALLDLSDDKLAEYDKLFARKHELAADVAESQLTGLKAETNAKILDEMTELDALSEETGKDLGINFATSIADGIKAGAMNIQQGLWVALENAKNAISGGSTAISSNVGNYTATVPETAQTSTQAAQTNDTATTEKKQSIVININGIQYQNFSDLAKAISQELQFITERTAIGYAGA